MELAMRTKDDCNQLLNATLPFAEQMLRDHGEFLPFGAQMLLDGKIAAVAVDDGEDHPASQNVINLLQAAFKAGAVDGSLIATALVYDVQVIPPGTTQKCDAIALNLDHCDNYSIKVFIPYVVVNGDHMLGEMFVNDGDYAIFPSPDQLRV